MRHRRKGRKLGRKREHRLAMFRNMTIALFEHGRIVTTKEKAKETRRFAEKLITLAKEENLHNFRRALQILPDKAIVRKLFREIAPRYRERPGGYTRILQLSGQRLGDGGSKVIFELVEEEMPERAKKKQEAAAPKAEAQPAAESAEKAEEAPAEKTEEASVASEEETAAENSEEAEGGEKEEETVESKEE